MENKILYYQLQKRTGKFPITDSSIDSVRCIKIPTFREEENLQMQQLHKKLLYISRQKNNSDEVGCLVSLVDWSFRFVIGTENAVSLARDTIACHMVKTYPRGSLVFLHNHPRNTVFSETDLRSFLKADSILLMSVVCNDGKVHLLMKRAGFQPLEAEIGYNQLVNETSEVSAVRRYLRICGKYGLYYKYGGN